MFNQDFKGFDSGEFLSCVLKVNQKVFQNYLKNFSGYNRDFHDIALTSSYFFTKLYAEPNELIKVQNYFLKFFQDHQLLYNRVFLEKRNNADAKENTPVISPEKSDKRFLAPQWTNYPYSDFIKQSYLLAEQLAIQIIDEVETGEPYKKKLHFYTRQFTNLFSPSNFLFTNPEAIELAIQTSGASLLKGFNNFVNDIEKGRISQVDESAFEVGKNLAVTDGAVIFESELLQLIQYSPTQKKVYEIPLLIIPPWINKYYILDLRPENSFVKYITDRGFSVFMISWKNPEPGKGHFSFDDYVSQALQAMEVCRSVSGQQKINTLGYCLGGTLLSIASSILAEKKSDIISSITFLAAMVDFSDVGPMGNVINEALVHKLEQGELLNDGVLHGYDMERAFNLIRANDLIWHYVINNYLKGKTPAAFDVMYWTNDNTNLPAGMYVYYMKHMILKNNLSRKNALHICDTSIDIGKITAPVYIIAMKEDYISPPATVFNTSELVSGPVEFILGESGHVMGVVNPPEKKKYSCYFNGQTGRGYENWMKSAKNFNGSWWTLWSDKLKENSGNLVAAVKQAGNEKYKVIEAAPGNYVKEKC